MRWGMVIDLRRCVGCQTCTIACKQEHGLPAGVQWRFVADCEVGEYPDTLAGSPPSEATQAASRVANGGSAAGDAMRDPVISLSVTNVALEGAALDLFKGTSELGRRVGDELMQHCYDYNWADEVTHTTIGDYFVKVLCEDNPEQEQRALRAHAMFEGMRERLSGQQSEEIKAFFAEEVERGTAALGGYR